MLFLWTEGTAWARGSSLAWQILRRRRPSCRPQPAQVQSGVSVPPPHGRRVRNLLLSRGLALGAPARSRGSARSAQRRSRSVTHNAARRIGSTTARAGAPRAAWQSSAQRSAWASVGATPKRNARTNCPMTSDLYTEAKRTAVSRSASPTTIRQDSTRLAPNTNRCTDLARASIDRVHKHAVSTNGRRRHRQGHEPGGRRRSRDVFPAKNPADKIIVVRAIMRSNASAHTHCRLRTGTVRNEKSRTWGTAPARWDPNHRIRLCV